MKGLVRFAVNWRNWPPFLLVSLFVFVALAAPLLAPPEDPNHPSDARIVEGYTDPAPAPPDENVVLGTVAYYSLGALGDANMLHFDVFYSLVWGTRSILRFGLITAFGAATIGVLMGAVSSYVGGALDALLMRVTDAFLAFPVIAGVWLFQTLMQTAGMRLTDYTNFSWVTVPETWFQRWVSAWDIDPVMLALIAFSWMAYARIINVNISVLKQTEYVAAARSLGAGNLRIIFRHLVPNAIAPIIVLLARDVGGMVVQQAAFAFIGVSGTVNSTAIPEWSRLLMLGRNWVIGQWGNPFVHWWVYIPVTLALILFGVGWNMLGDRLNVLLNPREVVK